MAWGSVCDLEGRKRILVEASAICGLPMEDARPSRGSKMHVGFRKT